jgi:hypothetical protein
VLEVFGRLNSYSVTLNGAEKRHALFQGEFKWAVYNSSRVWSTLWDKYAVLKVRQRVRMLDDQLTAEMYGVLINGVTDGGQDNIRTLYRAYDRDFAQEPEITKAFNEVSGYFVRHLGQGLMGTPILNAPHYLMLFAALAHAIRGIPAGGIGAQDMPLRDKDALSDPKVVESNLLELAAVIEAEEPVPGFEAFWRASRSSTQRIASRRTRFPIYCRALLPMAF